MKSVISSIVRRITYEEANKKQESSYSYWSRIDRHKSTIAHEIGHAFGLAHVDDEDKLMFNVMNTFCVDSCTSDELNGINALY